MSQENVELARQLSEAFNRAYADGTPDLYELLDPDIEWVPLRAILEGTTYRGREGVRQWIEELKRDWAAFETRPEELRDLGDDRVLALGSWHARGRGGDVVLDIRKRPGWSSAGMERSSGWRPSRSERRPSKQPGCGSSAVLLIAAPSCEARATNDAGF